MVVNKAPVRATSTPVCPGAPVKRETGCEDVRSDVWTRVTTESTGFSSQIEVKACAASPPLHLIAFGRGDSHGLLALTADEELPLQTTGIVGGQSPDVEGGTIRLNREIHSSVGDLPLRSEQQKL